MLGGAPLKIDASVPRLAQGVGGGVHHAGQRLDPVKLAQCCLWQDGGYGFPEGIVVNGLRQTACEPGRQLLEGHDLQPVPPPPCRLQPQLPHSEQAMGDDRVALYFWHFSPTKLQVP